MESPLPTFHLQSFNSRSRPQNRLHHKCEEPSFNIVSRSYSFLKYFDFRTQNIKVFWLVTSLHICFANRAWLKRERSLNLRPSFSLGMESFFHFVRLILLFPSHVPHQKLDIRATSSSLSVLAAENAHAIRWNSLNNCFEKHLFPLPPLKTILFSSLGSSSKPCLLFHETRFSSPTYCGRKPEISIMREAVF